MDNQVRRGVDGEGTAKMILFRVLPFVVVASGLALTVAWAAALGFGMFRLAVYMF
jgi:hypothetical protein